MGAEGGAGVGWGVGFWGDERQQGAGSSDGQRGDAWGQQGISPFTDAPNMRRQAGRHTASQQPASQPACRHAARCAHLDVADNADHDHGGALDEGHRLGGLLLVQLGAGLLHVAHDVGHARLVACAGRAGAGESSKRKQSEWVGQAGGGGGVRWGSSLPSLPGAP